MSPVPKTPLSLDAALAFVAVYDSIRREARKLVAGHGSSVTLQPTDLAHDSLKKLMEAHDTSTWEAGRWYAVAVPTLQNLFIDYLRHRDTLKNGRDWIRFPLLDDLLTTSGWGGYHAACVAEALEAIERQSPGVHAVVVLRFIGGRSLAETARALGVSRSTVERRSDFGRALLRAYLDERGQP